MASTRSKYFISIILSILAFSGTSSNSWANGDWSPISGARNGAMGGAGVAYLTDPTGLALNPALGAELGNELTLVPLFGVLNYQADGSAIGHPKQNSIARDVPGLFAGYNFHPTSNITGGVTLRGAGGPVQFKQSPIEPNAIAPNMDLGAALLISFPISYAFNRSFSVGVAPVLGYLSLRTNASLQSPWMPNDDAVGGGVRVGVRYDINQQIAIGGSLQSPIRFQKLTQYADIIKNNTQLPVVALLGTAWHMTPVTDILFDFEEIFWAGTSSAGQVPTIPGGAGWRDAYDMKVGVQQQLNDKLTLRAGYQYSQEAIPEQYVFPYNVFNVASDLAQHTVTGGIGYQPSYKSFSVDLTAVYGLPKSITENAMGPLGAAGQGYNINGSYLTILVGFNWKYC